MRLLRYLIRRAGVRASNALLSLTVNAHTSIYLAAAALVGFEGLEVLFGSVLFAPEFIPLVLIVLALLWVLRQHGRLGRRLLRLAWLRVRRRVRVRQRG